MQRKHDPGPYIISGAFHAEVFALKVEVGNLLQRIDGPEPRVELDAVDDLDFVSEPDVFRPQVPVAVENTPPPQSAKQQKRPSPEKLLKHPVAIARWRPREAKAAVKQYAAVLLKIKLPLLEIGHGRPRDCICTPVEIRNLENDGIEAMPVSPITRDQVIEHAPLIEAAHLHEPIDGHGALADCEPLAGHRQRNGAKINVAGEPPIEFHLGAACHLPLRERGKIEIREADRLLQFERIVPGEEHPRHVRLTDFDFFHGGAVRAGFAKKCYLFLKGRDGEPLSARGIPGAFLGYASGKLNFRCRPG